MHLVILEGVDTTGKSTLANKLTDEHPFFGCHWAKPSIEGDPFEWWKKQILTMKDMQMLPSDAVWIWDRSFLGNYIYGNYKRDQRRIDSFQMSQLLHWLKSLFSKIDFVLCRATPEELKRRFDLTGEQYITPEEAVMLQIKYEHLFNLLNAENPEWRFVLLPPNATLDENYFTVERLCAE